MAKTLENIDIIIGCGTDGVPLPNSSIEVVYDLVDGAKRTRRSHVINSPDFDKKVHDIGGTGEQWKDCVDAVKTAEGI